MRTTLIGAAAALLAFAPSAWADDATAGDAKRLLMEVAKAYQQPQSMVDEMAITYQMAGQEQKATTKIRMSPNAVEAKGIAMFMDLCEIDGVMYAQMVDGGDHYATAELGDDPVASANKMLGDRLSSFLPPHFTLRWKNGVDHVANNFAFGLMTNPKVTELASVSTADGQMHEIIITGERNGVSRVHVDPETNFIRTIITEGTPEGRPEDAVVTCTIALKPKVVDSLDAAIAFTTAEREAHETFDAMMMAAGPGDSNPRIEVGTEAISFVLEDQLGNEHDLASYRGRVVVMEWWGMW